MFISYSLDSTLGSLIIIDSDFQETIDSDTKSLAEYIIEVYSKRNLNVALNLFLFMQYVDRRACWDLDSQIIYYKSYVKDFKQYLPEIKKYLFLI